MGFGSVPHPVVDRIAGNGNAFVWAAAPEVPTSLRFDDDGTVLEPSSFQLGGLEVRVPAGALLLADGRGVSVSAAADAPVVVAPKGASPEGIVRSLRVQTGGPDAGLVTFEAEIPTPALGASLRYFYPVPGSGSVTLGRFAFPLFPSGSTIAVDAMLHPARPNDTDVNAIAIASEAPVPASLTTTSGQAVRLAIVPGSSRLVPQWDPVVDESYLTPDGEWQLLAPAGPSGSATAPGVTGASSADVVLGLSGLEFARVATPSTMEFVAGSPCYASGFGPNGGTGAISLTASCPGVPYPVTTAWTYFREPSGPVGLATGYYSQPTEAGMFGAGGASGPVLDQLPMRSAPFPAGTTGVLGSPAPSFPAVPYKAATGTSPPQGTAWSRIVTLFEEQVLTPARQRAIEELNDEAARVATTIGPGAPRGMTASVVTPQGLLSQFSPDYTEWFSLLLAKTSESPTGIAMSNITGKLRTALLSNQLFLVISDPAAVAANVAGTWELTIDDWTFDVTPSGWLAGKTVAILKFCDATVESLAGDWERWTEAEAFNGGQPAPIAAVLQDAVESATGAFADVVKGDWNGVLFLNVPVRGDNFPPELRGLAAGMSGHDLLAQYVGVNGAPIETQSGLGTGDSSVFALIDYSDPGDLSYSGSAYAFKVLSLHVEFANSHISGFSSQVELLVGELFGERAEIVNGEHGGNMIFNGTMQRHGAQTSFSFRSTGASLLTLDSGVISTVTLDSGEFATLVDETQGDTVVSVFKLGGVVRFRALSGFDLFSFGPPEDRSAIDAPGLGISNLVVRMTTTGSKPAEFAFLAGEATIDLGASVARPNSLYARFPLTITALLQGDGSALPAQAGYMPVGTPLTPGALGATWFGLAMNVDLGSAGGLASEAPLTASLLAAWTPSAGGYNVQVGVRLPGSQGGGSSLALMGPLRLDIGKILFLRDADNDGYLLRFENIALGFLGLKFPPNGRTNLLLFGNPDPTVGSSRLGWYGAYRKNKSAS